MSTKKNFWIGLPMQMMYGLVLGVIVGTMVSSEFGATYLQPLGQLFIRLIRMVVVPLVVATLIAGSAGLGNASKIGKIAVKTILFFAVTIDGLLFVTNSEKGRLKDIDMFLFDQIREKLEEEGDQQ